MARASSRFPTRCCPFDQSQLTPSPTIFRRWDLATAQDRKPRSAHSAQGPGVKRGNAARDHGRAGWPSFIAGADRRIMWTPCGSSSVSRMTCFWKTLNERRSPQASSRFCVAPHTTSSRALLPFAARPLGRGRPFDRNLAPDRPRVRTTADTVGQPTARRIAKRRPLVWEGEAV